jgi:hypothetical protein
MNVIYLFLKKIKKYVCMYVVYESKKMDEG